MAIFASLAVSSSSVSFLGIVPPVKERSPRTAVMRVGSLVAGGGGSLGVSCVVVGGTGSDGVCVCGAYRDWFRPFGPPLPPLPRRSCPCPPLLPFFAGPVGGAGFSAG